MKRFWIDRVRVPEGVTYTLFRYNPWIGWETLAYATRSAEANKYFVSCKPAHMAFGGIKAIRRFSRMFSGI